MVEIHAQTKKWGNSLGIIIPHDVVELLHLKPGQSIDFTVLPRAKDILARLPKTRIHWGNKSTQQLKDEIRKELWS